MRFGFLSAICGVFFGRVVTDVSIGLMVDFKWIFMENNLKVDGWTEGNWGKPKKKFKEVAAGNERKTSIQLS